MDYYFTIISIKGNGDVLEMKTKPIILKQFETKVRLDQLEIDYRSHLKIIKDER